MKPVLVAAALTAIVSSPSLAQSAAPPARCFIELHQLVAEGPAGIGELRSAIAKLDEQLRPEVAEVTRLRNLADTLETQQQQAMQAVGRGDGEFVPVSATQTNDVARVSQDLRRANDELAGKQARLKSDYEAQLRVLVGPVQQRISQRAIAFGTQRGCTELKMARTPDLAALRSSGARDLTGEFVTWYATGKS